MSGGKEIILLLFPPSFCIIAGKVSYHSFMRQYLLLWKILFGNIILTPMSLNQRKAFRRFKDAGKVFPGFYNRKGAGH
jgi:hypothetical protein